MSTDNTGEWQPIESAPRDGTKILVSRRERDGFWIEIAFFSEYAIPFFRRPTWFGARFALCFKPTHWMPLQPPPTA